MFLNEEANIDILCEVIDKSPDIIFTIDLDGNVLYVNDAFVNLLGYNRDEIIGKSIKIVSVEDEIYNACMVSVKETGKCLDQETVFRKKDGSLIHVVKNVNAVYDENGNIKYLIINARDLTHIDYLNKSLENLTKLYEERYNLIYQVFLNIKDAVAILDPEGRYIEQNKSHQELIGYSIEELKGKTPAIHLSEEEFEKILKTIEEKGSFFGEVKSKAIDGKVKDIELFAFPIRDEDGKVLYYVGIKRDITKEKEIHITDKLTGLYNRLKLIEDLKDKKNVKLILINIDSFKEINDVYGYEIGDKILKTLAERLKSFVSNHNLQIYKLSGDEFAILVDRYFPQNAFEMFINGLIYYIESNPIEIDDYSIKIDITLGIADSTEGNCKNLLEKADMALKYAKQQKKPYLFYREDLNIQKKYQENRYWLDVLKDAIKQDNLIVYYQGIFNNKTNKIEKYESLIRLKLEDKIISPFFFLEVAKKSKLYPEITKKVFSEAVKYAKDHEISINLSVMDILNEYIVSYILNTLKNNNLKITFEILESEGIENYTEVSQFIKNVKEYGCKIAIDDFGSGYSNFAHILNLDVDYLKIDASLIKNLDTDKNSQIVVETIVGFAKKLGIKTVAEFVHSKEVFDKVVEMGIDYSQGYYISEPKPNIS
ncbi:EAL domain-containing protein [Sulfurihydrogenibium sp.]|uniref:sensor domain-containing protein n=1 Tax=Sulfurihydrogenibium sp. TaxID=2053621 RepID=UPI00262BA7CF|nr:EAL domain-containing protein [Sulfurihydrogenibium sp.]